MCTEVFVVTLELTSIEESVQTVLEVSGGSNNEVTSEVAHITEHAAEFVPAALLRLIARVTAVIWFTVKLVHLLATYEKERQVIESHAFIRRITC